MAEISDIASEIGSTPVEMVTMDWGPLVIGACMTIVGAIAGYILAVSRDRGTAIRAKKIEAISRLHDRVLEIERKELSDGKNLTMMIPVDGGTRQKSGSLSDYEVEYQSRLERWRQELHEEELKARLWIDRRTVALVSNYFLLMMQCQSWGDFGQGSLIEEAEFLHRLRAIFGRTGGTLEAIVIKHSKTGQPWVVNCLLLSDLCLDVIQRRVRLEVSSPVRYRAMSLWWRSLDWRNAVAEAKYR